ncbi:type IV pilus modification protein PilV [Geopsychrobacter electrodiphilus]|uniref:type IV pilus modification protein PilV n=1 Tax=Geopsychrobacter electrodiphilus TaxID=225196 RepID=UPI000380D011|nr:type IV pilus modification protein PilV [Geopsychrobacter electrodiphilus]
MMIKGEKNNQGFTLIEVLVALIILSIGLLGVAGMQISSMRGNHNAYLRSEALQYAYEVADMMRANRTAAISSNGTINYTITATQDPATLLKTGIALTDLQEWRRGLTGASNPASGLPGGQGAIAVVANADNTWTVTITVSWAEGRLADDTTPSVVVETKL